MNIAGILAGCLLFHSCLSQQLQATDIPAVLKNRVEAAKQMANSRLQFDQAASNYVADVNVEAATRATDSLKVAMDNFVELERKRFEGFAELIGQGIALIKENSKNIPSSEIQNAVESGTGAAMNGIARASNTVDTLLNRYRALENDRLELGKTMAMDLVTGASVVSSSMRQVAGKAVDLAAGAVERGIDQGASLINNQLNSAVKQATQQLTGDGGRSAAGVPAVGQQNGASTTASTSRTSTTTTTTSDSRRRRG